MMIYHILFDGDICIKLDTITNWYGYYFRKYNPEFDSVCEFREILSIDSIQNVSVGNRD